MTSRAHTARRTNQAAADLANIAAYLPDLYASLDDKQPGYPTGRQGSNSTPSSVPERHAIAAIDHADPDRALSDLAQLDRILDAIARQVDLAVAIRHRWLTTTHHTPATEPDTWCTNHLTIHTCVPRGDKKGTLCTWCADFKNNQGYLPPPALMEMRDRGQRINSAHIERHRPRTATVKKKRRAA